MNQEPLPRAAEEPGRDISAQPVESVARLSFQGPPAAQPDESESSPLGTGLRFAVARKYAEVLEAWQAVYLAYRRAGLIDENPYGIHTVPQAIGPHAAVILGLLGPQIVTTLTAMLDSPLGLPLDCVYRNELDQMRREGRRLCEVGIFADRRAHLARSLASLLELMRYAFFYAVCHDCTDIVIGVHPHHSPFYRRAFAFVPFAPTGRHPTVNDNPVVPLRLDLTEKLKLNPLPRGLAYFMERPLEKKAFEGRFDFAPERIRGTLLEQFLQYRQADLTRAVAACSQL